VIEVVFFDAGETLLSPQPSWAERSALELRARGHDTDAERMREAWIAVGNRFREAAEDGHAFSVSAGASYEFWTSLYRELLASAGIDDPGAPDVLYSVFSDPSNYRLFDDALPALTELAARGLRLGIISNFESWLGDLLHKLEVLPHVGVVAISGDLGWEKPDPRIFKWAVEEAGVPAEACAHVGDSPFFDAEAACAAGLHGVLLDRHGRWSDESFDYPVISSLNELPDVLDAAK
jgi:putative hydrolase of the HAD superfamily